LSTAAPKPTPAEIENGIARSHSAATPPRIVKGMARKTRSAGRTRRNVSRSRKKIQPQRERHQPRERGTGCDEVLELHAPLDAITHRPRGGGDGGVGAGGDRDEIAPAHVELHREPPSRLVAADLHQSFREALLGHVAERDDLPLIDFSGSVRSVWRPPSNPWRVLITSPKRPLALQHDADIVADGDGLGALVDALARRTIAGEARAIGTMRRSRKPATCSTRAPIMPGTRRSAEATFSPSCASVPRSGP
jgi:hypothetical protein